MNRSLARTCLVLLFAGPALCAPGGSRADDAPVLPIPAPPDSVSIASPSAPLLIPGRASPGDSLVKTRAERARDQYQKGRSFEAGGQYGPAIASYRNALQLDPTLPDAAYRSGMLFLTVKQFGEAALEFAREVEHHPGNLEAARELGLALAQAGEADRAVQQLELVTRHHPRDEPSWQALGFAYLSAKRPKEAETALRRALALNPKDADAWRDLGVVLAGFQRVKEAEAAYRRALALDAKDATTAINLANLEARTSRFGAALGHYQAAERRDSTLAFAYQGQIKSLHSLQRDGEIGAIYRRWLQATPDDHQARSEAIDWFSSHQRKDIALELARAGVRANPDVAETHLMLGMMLESTGDSRTALYELRRAQGRFRQPEQRDRVRDFIAAMRRQVPDSLRAVFTADSLRFEVARPDSTRGAAQPPGNR